MNWRPRRIRISKGEGLAISSRYRVRQNAKLIKCSRVVIPGAGGVKDNAGQRFLSWAGGAVVGWPQYVVRERDHSSLAAGDL